MKTRWRFAQRKKAVSANKLEYPTFQTSYLCNSLWLSKSTSWLAWQTRHFETTWMIRHQPRAKIKKIEIKLIWIKHLTWMCNQRVTWRKSKPWKNKWLNLSKYSAAEWGIWRIIPTRQSKMINVFEPWSNQKDLVYSYSKKIICFSISTFSKDSNSNLKSATSMVLSSTI